MKFNYGEYAIINSQTDLRVKKGGNVHEDRNRYRQCNIKL